MKKRKKAAPRRRGRIRVRPSRLLRLTKSQLKARAKKWERMCFQTRFELEVFYRGYDHVKDRAIEKAAGGPTEGSGADFFSGLRDMTFKFKTEKSARAAAGRIKKAVRGVRCMLRSSKRV